MGNVKVYGLNISIKTIILIKDIVHSKYFDYVCLSYIVSGKSKYFNLYTLTHLMHIFEKVYVLFQICTCIVIFTQLPRHVFVV